VEYNFERVKYEYKQGALPGTPSLSLGLTPPSPLAPEAQRLVVWFGDGPAV